MRLSGGTPVWYRECSSFAEYPLHHPELLVAKSDLIRGQVGVGYEHPLAVELLVGGHLGLV